MTIVNFEASDGGRFSGYMAEPSSGKGPGLVVIQEIFGVNKVMRDLCDGFAAEGYFALCPDLFWRQQPGIELTDQTKEEWGRAFALMNGFDFAKGIDDLKVALARVRTLPGCTGRAGVVGYCLGGSLAYAMACHSDSDASVAYYPVQIDDRLSDGKLIKNPLLMHIAENDQFCPPESQYKIQAALIGLGHVAIYPYKGVDHAFARLGGANYDTDAAHQADARTIAFFEKFLKNRS